MNSLKTTHRTDGSTSILLVILVLAVLNISFSFVLQPYQYIDEILCFFSFLHGIFYSKLLVRKEFLCFMAILAMFLVYSFLVCNNVKIAAIRDALQFLKPFTCFYAVYFANLNFSDRIKNQVAKIGLYVCIFLLCMAPFIDKIYPNTTSYYHALTMPALLYLTFSKSENKKKYFLILLLPGLLSFRSKFVTELVLYFYFLYFLKKKIKISFKMIMGISIMAVVAIWLNWEKFSMYFIGGMQDEQVRTLMYVVSLYLAKDYFPFGSGLGTFGTDASAMYYSPIYRQYGLDRVWGCMPGDYGTDHSFFMDTFYPVIVGEMGVAGIVCFFAFFIKRWKTVSKLGTTNKKTFLILLTYVAIENIASSSFMGSTTIPIMLLMGLSNNKNFYAKSKYNSANIQC